MKQLAKLFIEHHPMPDSESGRKVRERSRPNGTTAVQEHAARWNANTSQHVTRCSLRGTDGETPVASRGGIPTLFWEEVRPSVNLEM